MPKTHPIQESFSVGELSPYLYGRVSTPAYKQAFKYGRNMVVSPRGPAYTRTGSEFVQRFPGYNKAALRTFKYTNSDSYAVMFLHNLMHIHGSLQQTVVNYILNPKFENNLIDWTVTLGHPTACEVYVDDNKCHLQPGVAAGRFAAIDQPLDIPDYATITNVYLSMYGLKLGGLTAATGLEIRLGSTPGAADILDEVYYGGSQFITFSIPDGTLTETTYLTIYQRDYGSAPTTPESQRTSIINRVFLGYDNPPEAIPDIVTSYDSDDLCELSTTMSPDNTKMYITHPSYAPATITYDPLLGTFAFATVTFTSAPTEWSAGNYPAAMTFHENRAWYVGCPADPDKIWGSKSGSHEDFSLGTAADDDAIALSTGKSGRVMWIFSGKELMVGTDDSEHAIVSDSDTKKILTPSTARPVYQTSEGSAPVQPLLVKDQMIFIAPDRRRVLQMWYQWTAQGWRSRELSFTANHLTSTAPIRCMTRIDAGHTNIVFVLDEGDVIVCTYYQDGEETPQIGWTRHTISAGHVTSATGVPSVAADDTLFVAVHRVVDGVDEIHLESVFNVDDVLIPYVDSHVHVINNPPATVITGLDHLEGHTVQVVTESGVHPDCEVIGGTITLDWEAAFALVGLAYEKKLETLPFITMGGSGESTAGHTKRWAKTYVRVYRSTKPIINGVRPPDRSKHTPMNQAEEADTGLYQVTNMGRAVDQTITIEQDLPLPIHITSVFGELGQHSL